MKNLNYFTDLSVMYKTKILYFYEVKNKSAYNVLKSNSQTQNILTDSLFFIVWHPLKSLNILLGDQYQ